MTEENKQANVKITVDNKSTEKLVEILEKERAEKEQKKEPDLSDLKIEAIQKFGRPDLFLDADSKESLNARITGYINEIASKGKGAPAGSPLVERQFSSKPEDLYTRKFYDSQQMVSELRRLSHEGTPEEKQQAEHYINELWRKYVLTKRANPTLSEPSQNPNQPEALSELDLVQKDGFLTTRNKEDGDLGQLQKKWREMRKRRMEGQNE